MNDLLREYVALYGKNTWALSTYTGNVSLIDHYIAPIIGDMKLGDINTRVIEKYYQQLLRTKAVDKYMFGKKVEKTKKVSFVTPNTIRDVHKLLRNCFAQAVKWELIEKNPCINATVPKAEKQKRVIWYAETLF